MKEIWQNRWKPNAKIISFEGIKRLIDDIIVAGVTDVDDSIINNLRYLEKTRGDASPEGRAAAERWNELSSALEEVLTSLQYQEQKVLILRYGLEDGKYRILREVGLLCDVTGARIYIVQKKALRKLRHPSRSRKLVRLLKAATPPLYRDLDH